MSQYKAPARGRLRARIEAAITYVEHAQRLTSHHEMLRILRREDKC